MAIVAINEIEETMDLSEGSSYIFPKRDDFNLPQLTDFPGYGMRM